MKYIISESRIEKYADDYIDSVLSVDNSSALDCFIVIYEEDAVDLGDLLLEYDYTDGRLWIEDKLLYRLKNFFGMGFDRSAKKLAEKFQDRYGVQVHSIEYSNK